VKISIVEDQNSWALPTKSQLVEPYLLFYH